MNLAAPTCNRFLLVLLALLALAPAVLAAGSYEDFLAALAIRESRGIPTKVNSFGYAGLYQMGEAALVDTGYYSGDRTATNDWQGSFTGKDGINSLADFLNSPTVQNKAVTEFHQLLASRITNAGLDRYVGTTVGGILITQSGLIAGAHLLGLGGIQRFLQSGGSVDRTDGYGTKVSTYINQFGGYTISAIAPPWHGGITPPPGGGSLPSGPPIIPVQPGVAFSDATGYNESQIRDAIAAIIAALLFLWAAWSSFGLYRGWRKLGGSLASTQLGLMKVLVVLCIALTLLS